VAYLQRKITEKPFWSKWPYKLVLRVIATESDSSYKPYDWDNDPISQAIVGSWIKERTLNRGVALTITATVLQQIQDDIDFGRRLEGSKLSLFFHEKSQAEKYARKFKDIAIELWSPASQEIEQEMLDNKTTIIYKKNYWYKQFPIRARILCTKELRNKGMDDIRTALNNLEEWKLVGQLNDMLFHNKNYFSIGQPYYIYMGSDEDAAMFRLLCDHWIDRFERIKLI
jgi:hypothetical protein